MTLHVRRPKCMKNMPLKEMEQDFYKVFIGWAYDPQTCQAVIALRDESLFGGVSMCSIQCGWSTVRRKTLSVCSSIKLYTTKLTKNKHYNIRSW
ncbi:hypothetical protein Hanom_Chr01g00094651 [Helianthus anomalus]